MYLFLKASLPYKNTLPFRVNILTACTSWNNHGFFLRKVHVSVYLWNFWPSPSSPSACGVVCLPSQAPGRRLSLQTAYSFFCIIFPFLYNFYSLFGSFLIPKSVLFLLAEFICLDSGLQRCFVLLFAPTLPSWSLYLHIFDMKCKGIWDTPKTSLLIQKFMFNNFTKM